MFYCFNREEILHATVAKFMTPPYYMTKFKSACFIKNVCTIKACSKFYKLTMHLLIYFIDSVLLIAFAICHWLLITFAVNDTADKWSCCVCTEGGAYNCYSRNDSVLMAALRSCKRYFLAVY